MLWRIIILEWSKDIFHMKTVGREQETLSLVNEFLELSTKVLPEERSFHKRRCFTEEKLLKGLLQTQCILRIQRGMILSFHSWANNASFIVMASATKVDLWYIFWTSSFLRGHAVLEVRRWDLASISCLSLPIMSHDFCISLLLRLLLIGSQIFWICGWDLSFYPSFLMDVFMLLWPHVYHIQFQVN